MNAVLVRQRCAIFDKVDVYVTGHVGFNDWVPHFFLGAHSHGSAALLAIKRRRRSMDDLGAIPRLVRRWLQADARVKVTPAGATS